MQNIKAHMYMTLILQTEYIKYRTFLVLYNR